VHREKRKGVSMDLEKFIIFSGDNLKKTDKTRQFSRFLGFVSMEQMGFQVRKCHWQKG